MGRSVPHNLKSTHQTEFVKIFNSLCGRYGRWEIWQDFITLAAIAISNTVDRSHAAEREKTHMTIAGKYKPEEMLKFSQMLQEVVIGMDFNPDQDFLGELYMALDLGNDHAGQFFTPYDVCRMMAEITGTDLQARIERDGWISVNDCACGAGALLVAFANTASVRRRDPAPVQRPRAERAAGQSRQSWLIRSLDTDRLRCAGRRNPKRRQLHRHWQGTRQIRKSRAWESLFHLSDRESGQSTRHAQRSALGLWRARPDRKAGGTPVQNANRNPANT